MKQHVRLAMSLSAMALSVATSNAIANTQNLCAKKPVPSSLQSAGCVAYIQVGLTCKVSCLLDEDAIRVTTLREGSGASPGSAGATRTYTPSIVIVQGGWNKREARREFDMLLVPLQSGASPLAIAADGMETMKVSRAEIERIFGKGFTMSPQRSWLLPEQVPIAPFRHFGPGTPGGPLPR